MAKDPKPLSELYEKATDCVEQTKEQVLGALQDTTMEDDQKPAEELNVIMKQAHGAMENYFRLLQKSMSGFFLGVTIWTERI